MLTREQPAETNARVLSRFITRWEERIKQWATVRPVTWAFLVMVVAATISLSSKFPFYADRSQPPAATFLTFPQTPYGAAVSWWLDHPFQPVPAESFFPLETRGEAGMAGSISHFDKLTFRVVLPLLNRVFHRGFGTLVAANYLAVLVGYLLLYVLARRQTGDAVLASLLVWAHAATWAGGWGFNDMAYGDAVAVALMLAVMAARPSWLAALFLLAAGFTDERALLAAPLLGLFRYWSVRPPLAATPLPTSAGVWRTCGPLAAAVGGYALIRLTIAAVYGVSSGTSMIGGTEILLYHGFMSFPGKIFGVFEFLWIYPLVLGVALFDGGGVAWRQTLAFALALGCATAPALLVFDIERSICYLLPAILLGVCLFPGSPAVSRRLLWAVTAANLVWFQLYGSIFRYWFL